MDDHQNSEAKVRADGSVTNFATRGSIAASHEWIEENLRGFLEGNAVLEKITGCLGAIPAKSEPAQRVVLIHRKHLSAYIRCQYAK